MEFQSRCPVRHRVESRALAGGLAASLALCSRLALAGNLVPDPSFEAPVPSWFCEDGGLDYSAGKQTVQGASDGHQVLAIEGWNPAGSVVWSAPFALTTTIYSAAIDVRSIGPSAGGSVELTLYDASKKTKLATFGSARIDRVGKWTTIRATAITLSAAAAEGVLGIWIRGPSVGSRVEVDRVALYPGASLEAFVDNARFTWFEAEAMRTNAKSWKLRDHYADWYRDRPSGMRMISGSDAVADGDDVPATFTVTIEASGDYTLWTRFLCTNANNSGVFSVAIEQYGKVLASQEIVDGDPSYQKQLEWTYVPLRASLRAGPVDIVLTRPPRAASGVARQVDMFALTNLRYYEPKIQDFRPQGYIRFTNLGESSFCLWQTVFRKQGPDFAVHRMLTAAGLSAGFSCPEDKRLLPGEPSPWVKVSDSLRPDRNIVTFTATTKTRETGTVRGQVKGAFEFALGNGGRVIKTISIDQPAPRVLFTVGQDFAPEAIRTANDYIDAERATVARIASASRPRAKWMDLSVILDGISPTLDPPSVAEREVEIVKALGFDGTYTSIVEPADTRSYYRAHDLLHLGIWGAGWAFGPNPIEQPDVDKIASSWKEIAAKYAPIIDRVERAKILDEPTSVTYEALVSSVFSRQAFRTWLKVRGLSPSDVGVSDWDEVLPVGPANGGQQPRLFYWTGMYRLALLSNLAKTIVLAKKNAGVPDHVKTYANYDPTWNNDSFTHLGSDPFLMQRDGGFEMGWTEDWLGFGASVEHVSDHAAVIRAAGAANHQELGMYVIGADGPLPLQRLRFYEALAAGARHICSYNYGPYYDSIDSWGTRYEVYPVISDALHDFGAVDAALNGAVRRKSDVAILYNRAAAIWADGKPTVEQDGRYIFWALAHAGYQPEFIAEEDVERGALGSIKALYALGVQMRRTTAAAIGDWIADGGVVFATAGAGSRDEYNQPLDMLDRAFGAHPSAFAVVEDSGRPKYELRTLRPLGRLATVSGTGVPEATFDRLCATESLAPAPDAKVILRDDAGAPAGVLHPFGKGVAVRIAALPGIAYLHDAVTDPGFDRESYHPTRYRTELRDFIAWAPSLAHAERASTNAPTVEVVRYDAPDRVVLVLVNYGAPAPRFEVTVADVGLLTGAYAATATDVMATPTEGGAARVALSLDVADAVVLTRRQELTGVPGARLPGARCGCDAGPFERTPWVSVPVLALIAIYRRVARGLRGAAKR